MPAGTFPKNPANTHVPLYDNRLLVLCEDEFRTNCRTPWRGSNQRYNFCGAAAGPTTPHFKVDPANGDFLFFGNVDGAVTWYRADRHGRVLGRHTVGLGAPTFTHDYVVTTDYAIFW